MKKLLSLIALGALAATAQATTYTFMPNDGSGNVADMFDLDHHYAYTWGIDGSSADALRTSVVSGGQQITSATLTIWNIWDWTVEPNDILNINLLDDTTKGVTSILDNPYDVELVDNAANDYFGSTGFLTSWEDLKGGQQPNPKFNLVYNFTGVNISLLTSYLLDSTNAGQAAFGLGLDPDCHYYNDGIQLVVNTAPKNVPENGLTLSLLGLGLVSLAGLRRRFCR